MWVRNKNWNVVLKSDIGIGTTWGNGVNAMGVTKEGKLIVQGQNEEELEKMKAEGFPVERYL